ncbi:YciI family protein [soil metagenome]
MTEYLLSVHNVEGVEPYCSPEEMQAAFAAVDTFNDELRSKGAWVYACGLMPADTATVVRAHEGDEVITTDGPFAESKEHLGGFWVIDSPDLDAALAWAEQASKACKGAVEVRPMQSE